MPATTVSAGGPTREHSAAEQRNGFLRAGYIQSDAQTYGMLRTSQRAVVAARGAALLELQHLRNNARVHFQRRRKPRARAGARIECLAAAERGGAVGECRGLALETLERVSASVAQHGGAEGGHGETEGDARHDGYHAGFLAVEKREGSGGDAEAGECHAAICTRRLPPQRTLRLARHKLSVS